MALKAIKLPAKGGGGVISYYIPCDNNETSWALQSYDYILMNPITDPTVQVSITSLINRAITVNCRKEDGSYVQAHYSTGRNHSGTQQVIGEFNQLQIIIGSSNSDWSSDNEVEGWVSLNA